MDMLESVAVLSGTLLVLIGLAAIIAAQWRNLPDGPVPLYEMLRRQSDRAAGMAIASGSRDFAFAIRRCVGCAARSECRAWLDSGRREGFEKFCANADYVSLMRGLAKAE